MGKSFLSSTFHFSHSQWLIIYMGALFVLVLTARQSVQIHQPLSLKALDIGQGDALLIQTPHHRNILIDTGDDTRIVDRLGEELRFFDRTIDLLIISHAHRDHYAGFFELLSKYHIKRVMINGAHSSDFLYRHFLDEIRARNIKLIMARNNQDIQIGPGLYLDILFPFHSESIIGQKTDNKNNVSIVLRLLEDTSDGLKPLAILTGDAEIEEERELLLSGQELTADILKVGHHGSRTATQSAFLAAVKPHQAIISCGKNNTFKHPHPETLQNLTDKNIPFFVTSESGTIRLQF